MGQLACCCYLCRDSCVKYSNVVKPDISNLRVFGCMGYAHVPDAKAEALQEGSKHQFIEHSIQSKGYRFLDEDFKNLHKERCDIQWTGFQTQVKKVYCDLQQTNETIDANIKPETEQEPVSNTSTCGTTWPSKTIWKFKVTDLWSDSESINMLMMLSLLTFLNTWFKVHIRFQNQDEALESNFYTKWRRAAGSEYHSLLHNNTWDLGKQSKVIKSKWVVKAKYGKNGEVDWFKAQLVAKGCANHMALTTMKPFLQWQDRSQFVYFLPLRSKTICLYIRWMLWLPFSMGHWKRYIHATARRLHNQRKSILCASL